MKRLAITVLVVGVMLAVGLFAMSAQNEGCLPWQERVGVTDGPFGPQQDITACR